MDLGFKFTKKPYVDEVGPRKIKSIQFSTFSGTDVMKAGEVQVYKAALFDATKKPIDHGLHDKHLGLSSKSGICGTCHAEFVDCPGHFGYLKLALPVFHVGYFKKTINILQCTCKSCARILLPEIERKSFLKSMRNPKAEVLQKVAILKKIIDRCKRIRTCPRCGELNGVVKKGVVPLNIFYQDLNQSIKKGPADSRFKTIPYLNPIRVLGLFRRMSDEDCEILCLHDRPENLIVTHIPVPPSPIRPSAWVDSGAKSNENDITTQLRKIIMENEAILNNLQNGAATETFINWEALQGSTGLYINGDLPVYSQDRHHKTSQGFVQRLKGKQGRFRGNLSGKRVNFTGRTVISPDPNLKITQVGIPILMAQTLTFPERVSCHNIEKLRQRVRNGPQKYPGANYVVHADGSKQYLKYGNRKHISDELKHGAVVERHLEDGDIVLFNRQPSLHRMSIMSHRAKVMPWRTLRFNESVCNPYNADFDGDEMNLHVPQTEEARAEAVMLMGVHNNLCTPKNGEILVASTQDFLTASFLITRKDTFYDRASFALMCSYMGDGMDSVDLPTPALLKPMELWTGKQLFGVLVRPNASTRVFVNFSVKERNYDNKQKKETMDPNDRYVYFRNSELISGQLGKATLGNGNTTGLYSVLLRDYNTHAAASCMNRLAKLSARWIGNHGFTIGIDDVQPGPSLSSKKQERIIAGYSKCDDLIQSYYKGKLTLQAGYTAAQTLEDAITAELNKIREAVADVCMKELHWRNSPLIMSQCGSKGSPINISQMIACVGQQSVGGKRAPNGFIERSLPHFPRNDKTPAAKGFVANSFYTGLTATEFFFHTMGGREGLVDTAVKTADTGYMSRRLMKSLEDLSMQYDETVRNASGAIVQLCYGEDRMDPSKMETKDGNSLDLQRLFLKTKAICPAPSHETSLPDKIYEIMKTRCSKDDMTPEGGCSSAFKKLLTDFIKTHVRTLVERRKNLGLGPNGENGPPVLNSVVEKVYGISSRQLEVFMETCVNRYHSKKVEAGSAVGAIGAQSIGEPGTQMTLKTFHFAGVASMNVTLGVPRIKEIINAAKNISTPIIRATLDVDSDVDVAQIVKGRIERTHLGEICKSLKIVYIDRLSPCFHVTLDKEIIEALHMEISAYSVAESILKHPRIKIKRENIDPLDKWKLRIMPPITDKTKLQSTLYALKSILPTVIVKGIPTVHRCIIHKSDAKDKTSDKSKYEMFVEGTNLAAVMGIPGVTAKSTTSNHIAEVERTLGIEAARKCIIKEIQYTMSLHSMTIDVRHMMLLADVMTFKGEVLGITRFGIKKMKDSVLMLASFEQTTDHLFDASAHGRIDQIEGVSECIIMGIPMPTGTGLLKVKQRFDSVPELKYGPDPLIV